MDIRKQSITYWIDVNETFLPNLGYEIVPYWKQNTFYQSNSPAIR